jgi:hypothetical protein
MLVAAGVVGKIQGMGDNGYWAGERHLASLIQKKITFCLLGSFIGIVT